MKKALTIWALQGGTIGNISVLDAAIKVKNAGFDALEASFYKTGEISLESRPNHIRKLKVDLQKQNLTLSSLSTLLLNDVSLTAEDKEESKLAFDICLKMIEIASELKIETVSLSPGKVIYKSTYRYSYEKSMEQMSKLAKIAEKLNVILCVENVWQGLILSPIEFSEYCKNIDSPNLMACLDIGNTMISSYPHHWVQELNTKIKKVHVTELRKRRGTIYEFVDPGKGNGNWQDIIEALEKVKYKGYLTIEAFGKQGVNDEERLDTLYHCLNHIERISESE